MNDPTTFAEFWERISANLDAPPHYVYKLYNSDDEFIYVGKAKNMRARMCSHWHDTPWIREVERIEVETHASEDEAIARELELILSAMPRHNRKHTGRLYTPGGYQGY